MSGAKPNHDRAAWLPRRLLRLPLSRILFALVVVALGIRVYLSLTSFCISGDGVAYLGMARDFSAGEPLKALDSVFSPLYPGIIALAHWVVPDWEIAGSLVSAILGAASVVTIYWMTRVAFARRDLALGAAALAAIHPLLAAYGGSVRTDAGYILLLTGAVGLLLTGLQAHRLGLVAIAGLVGGVAYLYRTEAIGLLIFAVIFIPAAALWWREWTPGWGLAAAASFAIVFLVCAAPYMLFLRIHTGHWSVGREFTAAMMSGMGGVAPNGAYWRQLEFAAGASPFTPLLTSPRLYLLRIAGGGLQSLYAFIQALEVPLTALLLLGLWTRGRALARNFAEVTLLLFTLFYMAGFSFSQTGTRFMVHLIPFTFGWVMLGLEALSAFADRVYSASRETPLPQGLLAVILALGLMPATLWPIGYDLRGLRYAGEAIARRDPGAQVGVVARDGRVAYYAHARFILLPITPKLALCPWLATEPAARFVLLDDHDERRLTGPTIAACVSLLQRYPRYGAEYFDLYAVRPAN